MLSVIEPAAVPPIVLLLTVWVTPLVGRTRNRRCASTVRGAETDCVPGDGKRIGGGGDQNARVAQGCRCERPRRGLIDVVVRDGPVAVIGLKAYTRYGKAASSKEVEDVVVVDQVAGVVVGAGRPETHDTLDRQVGAGGTDVVLRDGVVAIAASRSGGAEEHIASRRCRRCCCRSQDRAVCYPIVRCTANKPNRAGAGIGRNGRIGERQRGTA